MTEKPVFDTQEQVEEVIGLFIRYMNTIVRQFHEDPEGFQPLFENIVYEDDEGFRFAVEERTLGQNTIALLAVIEFIYAEQFFRKCRLKQVFP